MIKVAERTSQSFEALSLQKEYARFTVALFMID
jgi:hypothetical protein